MEEDNRTTRRMERDDFLVGLYRITDGSIIAGKTIREAAQSVRIPQDRAMEAMTVLQQLHLLDVQGMMGFDSLVVLTARGLDAAESLLERRGPALSDMDIHIHLEVAVGELLRRLDADTELPEDIRSDVQADIDAAATQLRAEHPNPGVIRGAFSRLGRIWPQFAILVQTSAALLALIHGL